MARGFTSASGFGDTERFDLRLQARNRRRLNLVAGSCAFVSLVFISWIFHTSWNVAFSDDAPSNNDEAALVATAKAIHGDTTHGLMTGRVITDPGPRLETHGEIHAVLTRGGGDDGGIAGVAVASENRYNNNPPHTNNEHDEKNGSHDTNTSAKREVHVRVHVVVESATYSTTELLLVRDETTKTWGPVLSVAKTSVPRNGGYKKLTSDPGVVDAAAAALFQRLGLGQPPSIEFMQGIPASGNDGDGDGTDDEENDASFVVVVRVSISQ